MKKEIKLPNFITKKDNGFVRELIIACLKDINFTVRFRYKEVKIYYKGIRVLEISNDKIVINKSMFIYNATNLNKDDGTLESNSIEMYNKVKDITNITIGYTEDNHIIFEKSDSKKFVNEADEDIIKIDKILKKEMNSLYNGYEKNNNFLLKFKSKEIDFVNLLKLQKILINEKSGALKSAKMNIGMNIKQEVLKQENLLEIKEKMIEAVELYLKKTKGKNNQDINDEEVIDVDEKRYQQRLMTKFDDICKNGEIFSKKAVPIEMEFYVYALPPKDWYENENYRTKGTNKGRVDNLIIDNNTAILTELKFGTGVFEGTNGIHKHLLDIYIGISKNKYLIDEINYNIEFRKLVLNYLNMTKMANSLTEVKNLAFYIICGSSSTENNVVEKKDIDNTLGKKVRELKFTKEIYKNYNDNDGHELIEKIKTEGKSLSMDVKVYITDENYVLKK